MNKKINILVTGCGGDIGQSIGKILNSEEWVKKLVGCDISEKNAGKFIYENFILNLPCSDPAYIDSLKDIIKLNNIDLIIPVSEPELRFFLKNEIFHKIGDAELILPNRKSLEIGFDKLKTANFLENHGLPFPETKLLKKNNFNFPIILKSRTGSGSSEIFLIRNQENFNFFKNQYPDFIAQEYLNDKDGEFTCGLFRSKDKEIRTIIFKRELKGGYSGYGEVIENSEIKNLLINLANYLDLRGSINVQLRLTKKGPVIFEINPRFSSTVRFRHLLDFKDLIWCIEDHSGFQLSPYKSTSLGKRFYKGFSEYISKE